MLGAIHGSIRLKPLRPRRAGEGEIFASIVGVTCTRLGPAAAAAGRPRPGSICTPADSGAAAMGRIG